MNEKAVVVLALGVMAVCASAQTLDVETLKAYGGRYSVDCKSKDADSAIIRAGEISFIRGADQVTAKGLETLYSAYGASPPKGFKVTVMGSLSKEVGLFFEVYRTGKQQYIQINGHPDAMKRIGRSDDDAKFIFCSKT